MTDRKTQILQFAIQIIANDGYAALGMRSLARASGLKLGAMQYHYRTREDLLRALVAYIGDWYLCALEDIGTDDDPSILEIVEFLLREGEVGGVREDKLWPQLWAMAAAEPLVKELLEDVYQQCLEKMEESLAAAGSDAPRLEALALMSLVEGTTVILQGSTRWKRDAQAVRTLVLKQLGDRYGIKKTTRRSRQKRKAG